MIDWDQNVYCRGSATPLFYQGTYGAGDKAFHGYTDPTNPERGWLYYNDDGSPFAKGMSCAPPPISNMPAFHPDQENLALPDPELEAMELSPAWGSW